MGFFDDIRKLTQPYDEDDEEYFANAPDPAPDEPTLAVSRRDTARYAERDSRPASRPARDYFAEDSGASSDFYREETRVISRAEPYREDPRPVRTESYREEMRQQPVRDSYRPAPRSDYMQDFSDAPAARPVRAEDRIVNIRTTTSMQVVLARPERFDQAAEIADHLREKRTVVMTLDTTNRDIARRLVDFLSGVAYANDGKIKKVAINTYIITPFNVDIMGDLIDELENSGVTFY